jgi:hypothetical protein
MGRLKAISESGSTLEGCGAHFNGSRKYHLYFTLHLSGKQCCGSGSAWILTILVFWIRIHIKKNPDPYRSDKLNPEPEPHQFADDKPNCMEYEPILALFTKGLSFYLEARIRIRIHTK